MYPVAVDASDFRFGIPAGCFKAYASGVNHQVIVVRLTPFHTSVIFIMMYPVAVDASDFRFGILLVYAIFGRTSLNGRGHVRIAEHFQYLRIVFQDIIRTPSHYNAGLLFGQFLNNLTFCYKQNIVR